MSIKCAERSPLAKRPERKQRPRTLGANGKLVGVLPNGVRIFDYGGILRPRGINPGTGKEYANFETIIFPPPPPALPIEREPHFRSKRERAMALRARMDACSAIYNAGWLVRNSYFGPSERQREMVKRFLEALASEMRRNTDFEAVIFAAADSLFSSPLGVPWEP